MYINSTNTNQHLVCADGQERDSYGSVRAQVRRRACRPQPGHPELFCLLSRPVPDGWATYYVNTLHLRILEETNNTKYMPFLSIKLIILT